MSEVRIALVQFASKPMAVVENTEKALSFIEEAARQGSRLIVFPELFTTGYDMEKIGDKYFGLGETLEGKTISAFRNAACKFNINIIAPICLEQEVPGVIYNSAVVISETGEVLGYYDKTHLWAGERFYFRAGQSYPVFDLSFGRIGVMICYDGGFPEVSRILALHGAELVLCPSAFPLHDKDLWDIYFPSRALENGFFVAGINLVHKDEGLHLFGNNKLTAPRGELMLDAPMDEEGMQTVDLDLARVRKQRAEVPFLKDRRPHSYDDIFLLD